MKMLKKSTLTWSMSGQQDIEACRKIIIKYIFSCCSNYEDVFLFYKTMFLNFPSKPKMTQKIEDSCHSVVSLHCHCPMISQVFYNSNSPQ